MIRVGVLLYAFVLMWSDLSAALPDYLTRALRGFPDGKIPPHFGFTVEITRNGHRIRERYEPGRPAGGRWRLLEFADRAPTPDEITQHQATRAKGGETASFQADFTASDIDRGTLQLATETGNEAVYTGSFTEAAAERDGFLGRLALRLTVEKIRGEVIAYELRLQRPFSPVLGVKISELVAGAEFLRLPGLASPLPRRTWSRFAGRIFFSSTREDLEATYLDYFPDGRASDTR